ncbi:MAG: transposase [Bacteroidetes bacterium]|nr:transposase [Bacteroidota bacterium]
MNIKKYRTPECKNCPAKQLCTGRQKGGREIERSQYAESVERNNKTIPGTKTSIANDRKLTNTYLNGALLC